MPSKEDVINAIGRIKEKLPQNPDIKLIEQYFEESAVSGRVDIDRAFELGQRYGACKYIGNEKKAKEILKDVRSLGEYDDN